MHLSSGQHFNWKWGKKNKNSDKKIWPTLRLQLTHLLTNSTCVEKCKSYGCLCNLMLSGIYCSHNKLMVSISPFTVIVKKKKLLWAWLMYAKLWYSSGIHPMNNILDDRLCFIKVCLLTLQRLWTSLWWDNLYTTWIVLIWAKSKSN